MQYSCCCGSTCLAGKHQCKRAAGLCASFEAWLCCRLQPLGLLTGPDGKLHAAVTAVSPNLLSAAHVPKLRMQEPIPSGTELAEDQRG